MMKKSLCLILLIVLCPVLAKAQNENKILYERDYVYMSIKIAQKNFWPVYFDVILEPNDTIMTLKTSGIEDFIKSVLVKGQYTHDSIGFEGIKDLYGIMTDGLNMAGMLFWYKLFDEMKKWGRDETFKLKTGENVYIHYIRVLGIVRHMEATSDSNGLDLSQYPFIKYQYVPVATTAYLPPNLIHFIKK